MEDNTICFVMRNRQGLYIANEKGEYTLLLKHALIHVLDFTNREEWIRGQCEIMRRTAENIVGEHLECVPVQMRCMYELLQNESARRILNNE